MANFFAKNYLFKKICMSGRWQELLTAETEYIHTFLTLHMARKFNRFSYTLHFEFFEYIKGMSE